MAHLNTNHGKMSKSTGEFLTVSLLEEKGYDPLAYRFFCLQSHYRKALVFSWENLDNAAAAYGKLIAKIAALNPEDGTVDEAVLKEYKEKFLQQMGNDLNTSMGVTALYDALKAKTNDATKLAILGMHGITGSFSLSIQHFSHDKFRCRCHSPKPSTRQFSVSAKDATYMGSMSVIIIRQRALLHEITKT